VTSACSLAVFAAAACLALADPPKKDEPPKLSAEEQMLLEWTNKARAEKKLPPVRPHATLLAVARAHAQHMAKTGELTHEPGGKKPPQRVEEAGYDARWLGENVGGGDGPLATIFKHWLESPVHRMNILSEKAEEIGLGFAKDAKGQMYTTQVFARPMK
jgi:uncharacterized protein YkwD